jgi:glutamine amidotransferase
MIGIIDYGAGNLHSVKKAFDFLDVSSRIIRDGEDVKGIDGLVLPGVGAFHAAVERLKEGGMFDRIVEWIRDEKPFLGICLGLQLLFESSEEAKGIEGMALFRGTAKHFREEKVPQIGWNQVICSDPMRIKGLESGTWFYFLHGYYIDECEPDIVAGTTEYGIAYPSIIKHDRVMAVQFHPEKSGMAGILLLKNWMAQCFQ